MPDISQTLSNLQNDSNGKDPWGWQSTRNRGVRESQNTCLCPSEELYSPTRNDISRSQFCPLASSFLQRLGSFIGVWFFKLQNRSQAFLTVGRHTYMSLYCTTRAQYQTVSTSMFTLKHVVLSSNFVRTMFSNKSLILLNSMMSLGWHSSQNLSNSMKR